MCKRLDSIFSKCTSVTGIETAVTIQPETVSESTSSVSTTASDSTKDMAQNCLQPAVDVSAQPVGNMIDIVTDELTAANCTSAVETTNCVLPPAEAAVIEDPQDSLLLPTSSQSTVVQQEVLAEDTDHPDSAGHGDVSTAAVAMPTAAQAHSFPFQPDPSSIVVQKLKGKTLRFQAAWFSKYPWLHYSAARKGVLCYLCMQTSQPPSDTHVEGAFTSIGFNNWKKALERFSEHESSIRHIDATKSLAVDVNNDVAHMLSKSHSKQQQYARCMLMKIITSLGYLARQGSIPIRGHDEASGNFAQLLTLRQDDCSQLNQWMKRHKTYDSPDIQNEMLMLMSHSVLRKVTAMVKQSEAFSVIVDGTQDCTHTEQQSVCIRFVDEHLKPREMFVGLCATASTTGQAIAALILDVLLRLDLPATKLRGQTFDGAANMSGIYNGAQAVIQKDYPLATFVHCGSHCTNLVAQNACEASPVVRDAIAVVHELGVFFHQSGKAKTALISNIAVNSPGSSVEGIRPLCPTRWTVRVKAIRTTLDHLKTVLEVLTDLSDAQQGDRSTKARGLLKQLCSGTTVLALRMAFVVFNRLEELTVALQGRVQTIVGMKEAVDKTVAVLQDCRSTETFTSIFVEATEAVAELELDEISLPRTRIVSRRIDRGTTQYVAPSAEAFYRAEFFKLIDAGINQLNDRFDQPGIRRCMAMEEYLLKPPHPPAVLQNSALTLDDYPELDSERLAVQLLMFHQLHQFSTVQEAAAILAGMSTECRALFQQVETLVKLLLVVPASSAEAERSFSALRRLKTWLRTTMTQSRLNHLCVLHVHNELADIDIFRTVLREFVEKNDSRKFMFGSN